MTKHLRSYLIASLPLLCLGSAYGGTDALKTTQQLATQAMHTSSIRIRVAAENMANNQSPNYIPKHVIVGTKRDRRTKVDAVQVKKVSPNPQQTQKVYNPKHPLADFEGFVSMPVVDPLVMMMDMQQSRLDHERAMRAYQAATEQRNRIISLIGH